MIPGKIKPANYLLLNASDLNDIEALQTDIMKFMAILGFCLMVIFAMVQTLPANKAEPKITTPEPAVTRSKHAVVRYEHKKAIKKPPLKKVAEHTQIQQEISTAEPGFSLIFETNRALRQLIKNRKIFFYAIIKKHASVLCIRGDKIGYAKTGLPDTFYEMEPNTVPKEFKTQLQKNTAAFGNSDITWGVTLPEKTMTLINNLMAANKGGVLVIMPNGGIRLTGKGE